MGVFSVIALVLGAVGIYGLMAYTVARRTREIGLRIALGADHSRVLGLIVKQGMVLTLIGIVGGVGVALVASRVVAGLVFEVSVRDPVVFTAAPLALLTVALVAAYLPARRGSASSVAAVRLQLSRLIVFLPSLDSQRQTVLSRR